MYESIKPNNLTFWRSIILFGQNSASYKFALGTSLLALASEGRSFVSIEELALPFATQIADHLKSADKQGQRPTGPFLDACRSFNRGEIDPARLRDITNRFGFVNVIDAFHKVNMRDVPVRFFHDERKAKKGVTLTDELLALKTSPQFANLPPEVGARWRLVETAWELDISRNNLRVDAGDHDELYVFEGRIRRKSVAPLRDALNGYQKGKCFYCFRDISIDGSEGIRADVDHFFPWILMKQSGLRSNQDGIWNLVLACSPCNRGQRGKFALVPDTRYLERLERRNNYLIESHHPLRETLMAQTGSAESQRADFLRSRDRDAISRLVHRWKAESEEECAF